MIYVASYAKWASEKAGELPLPGKFTDFFYETDDPTFFDKYSSYDSVFYPKDGGHFFETHEEYNKWLEETGNEPWPDAEHPKPVSFMKVNPGGLYYTIEWTAANFGSFHANWETLEYNYAELNKKQIRIQWLINEAIGDYINERFETLDIRNAVAVLLDYITGNITAEELEKIKASWLKCGNINNIDSYYKQEQRVRSIVKTMTERKESEDQYDEYQH